MELALGRRRFDVDAGVVVLATVGMGVEFDDGSATMSDPISLSHALGPIQHSALAATLADAELLIAAGADAVEIDACTSGTRGAHDSPPVEAAAWTVAAMTARLSVPVGVRTTDASTAVACLEAGATLLALPADAVDSCVGDAAFMHAVEAKRGAVMVGKSSSGHLPAAAASTADVSVVPPPIDAARNTAASDAAPSDAVTARNRSLERLAVELSVAAARARDSGLPGGRVLVDLTDPMPLDPIGPDELDAGQQRLRSRRAARLAEVVEAVDRLVHDGELVAVGGWDDGDPESAIALTSLTLCRGARVVRSRSPRLVRRVARVVDAMSAATRPAGTRRVVTRRAAPRPSAPRTGGS